MTHFSALKPQISAQVIHISRSPSHLLLCDLPYARVYIEVCVYIYVFFMYKKYFI